MIRCLARAKVNLSLDVGPVRPDGYHPYVSHAISVTLEDELVAEPWDAVDVVVEDPSGSVVEDTLVRRALDLAGASYRVWVSKRIPAGAGLAGGSADAAAALVLAGRSDLAAEVGTDVAFCAVGGHARLTGRGEVVEPLAPLPTVGILVAVPPVAVPTPAVFAAFDEVGPGEARPLEEPWLVDLVPGCTWKNDLEAAALAVAPELAGHRRRIEEAAGRSALMTGSGSGFCVFAPDAGELEPAAATLRAAGYFAEVATPADRGVVCAPGR